LLKILQAGRVGEFGCAVPIVGTGPFDFGVQIGREFCQTIDVVGLKAPFIQLQTQEQILVKLMHLDGVLEGLAITIDHWVFGSPADRNNSQVEVPGQAGVEPQFFSAKMVPLLESGEVQKTEVEWLLQLESEVTGEKDPRDVGLHEFDIAASKGVSLGSQKSPNQGWLVFE